MRPTRHLMTGLAAAMTLSATALHAGQSAELGSAPVLGGGEYSTGGGITVAVELRDMEGRTGLCGVWAESERLTAYVRHKGRRVLSRGSIALDGHILTNNLDFLKQVAPAETYAGAPAGCTRLARTWRPGDAAGRLEVWIPRQDLHSGRNGRKSGGPRITFRDTGLRNPAMTAGSILPKSWTSISNSSGGRWQQRRDLAD